MARFKPGDRVRVKEFTGTVIHHHDSTITWQIRADDTNDNHYIFDSRLEKIKPPLPYIDGKKYIDYDGDVVTFRATGDDGAPGWEVKSGYVNSIGWARRPLLLIGAEITEED